MTNRIQYIDEAGKSQEVACFDEHHRDRLEESLDAEGLAHQRICGNNAGGTMAEQHQFKAGDFVEITLGGFTGRKGRILGRYPDRDGVTFHIKTPTGNVHLDLTKNDHAEAMRLLPEKAAKDADQSLVQAAKDRAATPFQLETIAALRKAGQTVLRRLPGGFWTYPGCPDGAKPGVPEWYVTTQTVRAMEDRGLLARSNVHPEEWKDDRALTEKAGQ